MAMLKGTSNGERGFTLIELLIVIAIIGVLASVVLISLNSARTATKDKAVFATMKSVQSAAMTCLAEGKVQRLGTYNVVAPICDAVTTTNCICRDGTLGPNIGSWPNVTTNYNWTAFGWCSVSTLLSDFIAPITQCAFDGITCGVRNNNPDFCFFVRSLTTKYVVCTEEGCRNIGF